MTRALALVTAVVLLTGVATAAPSERVIEVTAKRFAYSPSEITLQRGVPVVLELTSLDRDHGFRIEALGIRADVKPGVVTRVRLVPDRVGRFEFTCDVFCGDGHEDMSGEIVVVD